MARILSRPGAVLVYAAVDDAARARSALEARGAEVVLLPAAERQGRPGGDAAPISARRGINELHVEAGAQAQRLAAARRPGRRAARLRRAAPARQRPRPGRARPARDAGRQRSAALRRGRARSATTCASLRRVAAPLTPLTRTLTARPRRRRQSPHVHRHRQRPRPHRRGRAARQPAQPSASALDDRGAAGYLDDVGLGDSIALNGACMTVVALDAARDRFHVDISAESLARDRRRSAGAGDGQPRKGAARATTGSTAISSPAMSTASAR